MPQRTTSRLANVAARNVFAAFAAYREQYQAETARAQRRFEQRAWKALQSDAKERLELYRQAVARAVADVAAGLEERFRDLIIWVSIKAVYSLLIESRRDWELAESFFNSVTRRVFAHVGLNPNIEFVDSDFDEPPIDPLAPAFRTFFGSSPSELLLTVFGRLEFHVPWANRAGDAQLCGEIVERKLADKDAGPVRFLEVAEPVFYRDRRAYVVSRAITRKDTSLPVVVALANGPRGLYVDALLTDEDDVSILFSFARSYFHVSVERPFHMVRFLRKLMPKKRVAELYISMGFNKHGKTELYRDILRRLAQGGEHFEIAPGARGMVMVAFVLPSYDLLFKVIKDRFPAPKRTSRSQIRRAYQLVFEHDRAGRLIDAQEFEHVELSRSQFQPALLAELLHEAQDSVIQEGERVILSHTYVERRVTPLNIYLGQVDKDAAALAIIDYGNAIRDLAHSNIFPSDMLVKNFGVTRHGRVVFYDYDELGLLTDYTFRRMPKARTLDEEMAAEPWFSVGDHDVFPEEFPTFLGIPRELQDLFAQHHGYLFDPAWWQEVQRRINRGELLEVAPYGESCQLRQ